MSIKSGLKQIKTLFFHNTSTKQTIIKNIFWLSSSQSISRFIRGLAIMYAARLVGATEFGIFSYALGLAGFFNIFSDVGINSILTRDVAKRPELQSDYFATSFWLKICLLVFTASLIIFIAPLFSKIDKAAPLLLFMAFLVIFDGIRELILAFFRSKNKMEAEALVTIFTNISIAVILIITLKNISNTTALTVAYVLSAGLGTLFGILLLKKEFAKIISHFNKTLVKPILNTAWSITIVSVAGIFMLNLDIVMLGWWRSAEEIGLYSASQRILGVLFTIGSVIAISSFPTLSYLVEQGDKEKIRSLTEKLMTIMFSFSIPLVIGGIILGKQIVSFIYGTGYISGAIAFQILIFFLLTNFASYVLGNFIFAYNKQNKVIWCLAVGSLMNFLGNALLIPRYGILGAALATIITQAVSVGCIWYVSRKINKFYTLRHLPKIILAAFIMGIISFVFNTMGVNLILNITISTLFYFLVLYVLKEKILMEFVYLLKKFVIKTLINADFG